MVIDYADRPRRMFADQRSWIAWRYVRCAGQDLGDAIRNLFEALAIVLGRRW